MSEGPYRSGEGTPPRKRVRRLTWRGWGALLPTLTVAGWLAFFCATGVLDPVGWLALHWRHVLLALLLALVGSASLWESRCGPSRPWRKAVRGDEPTQPETPTRRQRVASFPALPCSEEGNALVDELAAKARGTSPGRRLSRRTAAINNPRITREMVEEAARYMERGPYCGALLPDGAEVLVFGSDDDAPTTPRAESLRSRQDQTDTDTRPPSGVVPSRRVR